MCIRDRDNTKTCIQMQLASVGAGVLLKGNTVFHCKQNKRGGKVDIAKVCKPNYELCPTLLFYLFTAFDLSTSR